MRLSFVANESIVKALRAVSKKTKIRQSALIRMWIKAGLKSMGEIVTDDVEYGGKREKKVKS